MFTVVAAPLFALLTVTSAPELEATSQFHTASTEAAALQQAYDEARSSAARSCFASGGAFEQTTAVELTMDAPAGVDASVVLGFRCTASSMVADNG